MPITKAVLVVASSAAFGTAGLAQRTRSDSVDRFLVAEMTRRHIPGMAIAVMRGDSVLKMGYYGTADIQRKIPVSAATSFAIASMSKAFTDVAALMLADEGKLSLDDSVRRYLPDAPSTWSAITLRRLMNHTSGLVDDWDHDWDEIPGYFMANQSDSAFLAGLYATPLLFAPGTRMEYSAGPFVVGVVLSKVTKQSYSALLQERIFTPLGMTGTYVNDPYTIRPNRASGYLWWEDDATKPWPWMPPGSRPRGQLTPGLIISPAAEARGDVGVATTAEDMVKWLRALLGGRLSPATRDAMLAPTVLSTGDTEDGGFGWFQEPDRTGLTATHGGNFRTGYSSMVTYHARSHLSVVVLTNLAGAADESLAEDITAFFDRDHAPISTRAAVRGPAPELANIERAVRAIAAARIDSGAMVDRYPQFYHSAESRTLFVADSVTSRGCEDVRRWHWAIQGYRSRTVCYFQLHGAESRYAWAAIAEDGRVSYVGKPRSH